ncbi:hypothetical protein BH10PSE10_BH10PSE10_01470 [soil metagenome]
MRDVVSVLEARTRVASVSEESDSRIHMFAVYGAFALITTIVFGTLSYHPF